MSFKKVVLNYDDANGQVTDRNGTVICTWLGLESEESVTSVETLVKLKNAGFSADEIISLSRKELI